MEDQGKWLEAEKTLREAIRIQEPLAAEFPETTEFREDLALSLCKLADALHHLGQSAQEAEEVLRRSIGISRELVNATPKLIFRRVIISGALMALATLERDRGHFDASERTFDDARSHIRIGLEINPLDPDLNKLNREIKSLAKGKVTTKTTVVRP